MSNFAREGAIRRCRSSDLLPTVMSLLEPIAPAAAIVFSEAGRDKLTLDRNSGIACTKYAMKFYWKLHEKMAKK